MKYTTQMALEHPAEVIVCADKAAISRDCAYRFCALAAIAAAESRPFRVALAGGSTPQLLYEMLASPPFVAAIPWERVQVFFGDERMAPPHHADSNYRMANEALLARVPALQQPGRVFRIRGEMSDPEAAAADYEAELRAAFGLASGQPPAFDLILLGMGPDGHTASLFPHKPALQVRDRLAVATEPGLKPFVPRVTLTYPVLNAAANVLFLLAGEDKAETVARILTGPEDADTYPSQAVRPETGTLTWLLDRAAARGLSA